MPYFLIQKSSKQNAHHAYDGHFMTILNLCQILQILISQKIAIIHETDIHNLIAILNSHP